MNKMSMGPGMLWAMIGSANYVDDLVDIVIMNDHEQGCAHEISRSPAFSEGSQCIK